MGGIGSDIAIEAADIALVGDDIKEIPHLILLSKQVMRTIKINLSAAMLLNFAAIVLAIAGILNPVVGALVHNAGSVAVIVNSSLLLNWRKADKR
jgi:cation transport ATPase